MSSAAVTTSAADTEEVGVLRLLHTLYKCMLMHLSSFERQSDIDKAVSDSGMAPTFETLRAACVQTCFNLEIPFNLKSAEDTANMIHTDTQTMFTFMRNQPKASDRTQSQMTTIRNFHTLVSQRDYNFTRTQPVVSMSDRARFTFYHFLDPTGRSVIGFLMSMQYIDHTHDEQNRLQTKQSMLKSAREVEQLVFESNTWTKAACWQFITPFRQIASKYTSAYEEDDDHHITHGDPDVD